MSLRHILLAILAAILCAVVLGATAKVDDPAYADASEFLYTAHHILNDRVFSDDRSAAPATPKLGREPGYPAFLAMLTWLDPRDPGLRDFGVACDRLGTDPRRRCPADTFRAAQIANAVLIALAGLIMFLAAGSVSGSPIAAWVAGLHIWLNAEMAHDRGYVISDYLALLLAAATLALLLAAARSGRPRHWFLAGLALAALTLTKAIYLYVALPAFMIAVAWLLIARRRHGWLGLALALLAYALPVGGWIARNHEVAGTVSLTYSRGGIALSTRAVFNDMTAEQYLAAFVFWTRGFGDDLARDLFPPKVWRPFRLDEPDGFYARSQFTYGPRTQAIAQRDGIDMEAARAVLDAELRGAILGDLPKHIVVTAPIFYRAIWIDEFIVLSLPALAWLLWWALARRRGYILLALAPTLHGLLFYALFSLNIPRYQITSLPGLGLAFGIAAASLWGAWANRRQRAEDKRSDV